MVRAGEHSLELWFVFRKLPWLRNFKLFVRFVHDGEGSTQTTVKVDLFNRFIDAWLSRLRWFNV